MFHVRAMKRLDSVGISFVNCIPSLGHSESFEDGHFEHGNTENDAGRVIESNFHFNIFAVCIY